jgi:hypothetical protein
MRLASGPSSEGLRKVTRGRLGTDAYTHHEDLGARPMQISPAEQRTARIARRAPFGKIAIKGEQKGVTSGTASRIRHQDYVLSPLQRNKEPDDSVQIRRVFPTICLDQNLSSVRRIKNRYLPNSEDLQKQQRASLCHFTRGPRF